MKKYILAGLLIAMLAIGIIFKIASSGRSLLDKNRNSENSRHSSSNTNLNRESDNSFDTSSNSYLKVSNLERLLALSNSELKKALDGLDQVQVSSVLNALGGMASADINSRGDYSLARRLVGVLDHRDASRIVDWMFHSKSPLGWELDFREQGKVVEVFSNGKPTPFLRGNFLRSFGALQGGDVAKSGTLPQLNKYEYLSYLDGVCQSTREAAFGNLLLIRDKEVHESAVKRAVPALMAGDAEGFSTFLGKMPPSDTKDLAVFQMIKWLTQNNSRAECPAWIQTITSPAIKAQAERVIVTNAPK